MHLLIIQKSDGVIVHSRYDTSTGSKMTSDEVLSSFVEGTNANASDFEILEIPFTKFELDIGKQIYNKTAGAIELNPNWVEPARESTSGIPTTDSSTGETVNG